MTGIVLELHTVWSAWKASNEGDPHRERGPVTVSMAEGEWIAVIGWNGVGKSTLLRGVAGLGERSGGRIATGGRTLASYSVRDRFLAGIAYVGQSRALPPGIVSWNDAVAFATGMRPGILNEHALGRLRAHAEGLRWLVAGRIDPSMVDLVLAIMTAPSVLILDELGARAKECLGGPECYRNLRAVIPSTAVLLVDHDQVLALRSSTRVIHMHLNKATSVEPSTEMLARLTLAGPSTAPAVELPYYRNLERLLELEAVPERLLRRALRAGGFVRVRHSAKELLRIWPFLKSRSVTELSGGERVILASLAHSAAAGVFVDHAALDHVHRDSRARLRQHCELLAKRQLPAK